VNLRKSSTEIQLFGVEQQPAHSRRYPEVAPYQEHRRHFQKDVFEQQPAPHPPLRKRSIRT